MDWWLWLLAGLGLLAFELVTPGGFVFVFFGLAALLVGALAASGVVGALWLQWALFSVFTVGGVAFFRRPLMRRFGLSGGGAPVDELEGEWAVVVEEIRPGDVGKVELRGTPWSARAHRTMRVGERVRVEKVEGLTVWLSGGTP